MARHRDRERREIFLRLIDPRAAANHTLDGICILDKLHSDEFGFVPMHFYPASGKHVDEGVALINDLLYYDASRPIDDENYPRLYISSDCPNLIYAMREWTYVDKDRGACKDPVDCCRMLVMDDNLMVEDGCMEMRGEEATDALARLLTTAQAMEYSGLTLIELDAFSEDGDIKFIVPLNKRKFIRQSIDDYFKRGN